MFSPRFEITPTITKALMQIEAVRQAVVELPFDVEMLRSLRETARLLDPRQRQLLALFKGQGTANTAEIAEHLGLSPRTVVALCRDWVGDGFLQMHDPSRKNRSFRLGTVFEDLI